MRENGRSIHRAESGAMKKSTWFLLGSIVFLSVGMGFFTLTRGHPWWDDFAGYLLQAGSILAWNMGDFIRQSTFTIENSSFPPGPIAYPWGFPLLLAPVYAVFGLNPLALKLVGLFFYAVFLVSLFFLARSRLSDGQALLLSGALVFLPVMIAANDLILSDIPFLAFSTLNLVLIDRLPGKKSTPSPLLGPVTGAAIFMAFFLRTNGVLLLAPLLLSLVFYHWPDLRAGLLASLPALLTFAILVILQAAVFPGGQGSYFSHFSMLNPQRLADNFLYYLWLPVSTFDQIPGGVILYALLLVFALFSLSQNLRRDAALHFYSLLTFVLFIVWPERQGLRFIYPVLPFLFISALDGMVLAVERLRITWQPTARGLVLVFWGLLLVGGLGLSAVSAYQNTADGRVINGPFDPYSYELYTFIKEKTPADSVIIFVRPRALRLFTGRSSFMTENCADLVKGDYVALHLKMEDSGQIAPEKITACPLGVQLEQDFQNKRFVVYKIKR